MRQYTWSDLVNYGVMILVTGGTNLLLRRYVELPSLVILIIALVLGVGCGWLAERAYKKSQRKKPSQ